MTKGDVIKEFANERPTSRGVYGYGSNVFKQASVDTQESQTDVIFIVDDLREWHQVNMEWNPKDYSFLHYPSPCPALTFSKIAPKLFPVRTAISSHLTRLPQVKNPLSYCHKFQADSASPATTQCRYPLSGYYIT